MVSHQNISATKIQIDFKKITKTYKNTFLPWKHVCLPWCQIIPLRFQCQMETQRNIQQGATSSWAVFPRTIFFQVDPPRSETQIRSSNTCRGHRQPPSRPEEKNVHYLRFAAGKFLSAILSAMKRCKNQGAWKLVNRQPVDSRAVQYRWFMMVHSQIAPYLRGLKVVRDE